MSAASPPPGGPSGPPAPTATPTPATPAATDAGGTCATPPPTPPPSTFNPHADGPVPNIAPPPATDPNIAATKKAADDANAALQHPGAPGTPGGRQAYNLAVPFAGTSIKMGVAAGQGGAGASLTTSGSVLTDSKGPSDFQAAGSMAIQTDAAMAAVSTSGVLTGTPASIEITAGAQVKLWAGSAVAPAACGTGGPGATPPAPSKVPSAAAEQLVAAALIPLGVAKTASDVTNLGNAGGAVGVGLGMLGVGGDVAGGVATAKAVAGAGGGGGGTNVDIRGPSGIKMLTMNKIIGIAMVGIDFKTVAKFSGMAAGKVEVQSTLSTSMFALIKAEMRGLAMAEVWSGALIGINAPKVTIAGKAHFSADGGATKINSGKFSATFKASSTMTSPFTMANCKVTIEKDLNVTKKTTVHRKMAVADWAKVQSTVTGNKKATFHEKLEAKQIALGQMLEVGNVLKVGDG